MIVAVDGAAIGPPPGGIIAELGGENESDRGSRHRSSLHLMKNVPMLNHRSRGDGRNGEAQHKRRGREFHSGPPVQTKARSPLAEFERHITTSQKSRL
jgi:hypothetical protein